MEGLDKISKFEENTLVREIYNNAENLPHNEQSVHSDHNKYGKEHYCMKVNDDKNSLPENLDESNLQRKSAYSIKEDSCMRYSDCGEPFKHQRIKIDFTSVPGVDDDELLQQKCIDFWEFVNKHPKLQSRVEVEKANESFSNETDKISVNQGCSQEDEIPAVKALRRIDNEYIVGKTKVEQRQVKLKKRASFSGLKPRSGPKDTKDKSSIVKSGGVDEVKMLCHKMDEWDLCHPRTMEPPNLAPSLKDLI